MNCVLSPRRAAWPCWCAISPPRSRRRAIKLKGPPVSAAFGKDGAPGPAALKFAEKCGVEVGALSRVTEGKGEFLYFEGSKPGQKTASLLAGIVQRSLDALPIPKRMRWGASTAEFVRPVHWLVLLYGAELIPARIARHRCRAAPRAAIDSWRRGNLPLAQPAEYEATLRERGQGGRGFRGAP